VHVYPSKWIVKTTPVLFLSLAISFCLANFGWAHNPGNGGSTAVGHHSRPSFGHSAHGSRLSTRRSYSHGHLTHHSLANHHRSLAEHQRSRGDNRSRENEVAQNETLHGEKKGFVDGLPPGQESRLDRGKGLSAGWQKKVDSDAQSQ
jgi:hypothetical protein